ncbi:MAG: anthranilate synthase component I [Deltaproteobacteria bacterium]
MIQPSLKEFLKLSRSANVIPIYKEISGDLDTPVSSYLKFRKDKYSFLLESVEGQEKIARFSFLGTRPYLVFRSRGRQIEVLRQNGARTITRFTTDTDPLDELKKLMAGFKPASVGGLPRFSGGMVGYLGYDAVRFFERLPDKNPDELAVPDSCFMLTELVLAFDHVDHTIKIISNCILEGKLSLAQKKLLYARATARICEVERELRRSLGKTAARELKKPRKIKITSNFEKSGFCDIVNKAKNYIKKGDIIQVVPSQRFKTGIRKAPFDIYRDLRSLNPSPYMFFLTLDDTTLIGSSPELLVRCEDGVCRTRPIAGTRRRGRDEREDKALESELLKDTKEKAEHLMLVDLGRNDLGRICKPGTVKVDEFMGVEKYSHVMHLVSDVTGRLDRRFTAYECLKACFPAGTVSGAPKIRAMEIIDELENTRRGVYAGAVGYFSFSGAMDTCIAIRTILVKGGYAYVQAGGGVVADSVPEKEYMETVNKAKALMEAIAR